jgi:hypothetical protein
VQGDAGHPGYQSGGKEIGIFGKRRAKEEEKGRLK